MRGWWKLTVTQAKLFLREPEALFFTLIFPALLLTLFGVIFGNEPDPQWFGGKFGYVDTEVPALGGIIIGTVALMSIPITTATARERGILRRYRATPMRPVTYITTDVVVNFVITSVGMAILIMVGKILFGLRFEGSWPSVVAGFTLSALAFFAVGYLVASLSPTARIAQTVGMALFFPMMFLSGATFPLEMMPESVRRVSHLLPMTHVVKLLQGLWFGETWGDHLIEVIVVAGMLIGGVIISTRTFRWE